MQPGRIEQVGQDAPGLRLEANVEGQIEEAAEEPQAHDRVNDVPHQSPVDFAIVFIAVQSVGHRHQEQVDGEVPGIQKCQAAQAESVEEGMLEVGEWRLDIGD